MTMQMGNGPARRASQHSDLRQQLDHAGGGFRAVAEDLGLLALAFRDDEPDLLEP